MVINKRFFLIILQIISVKDPNWWQAKNITAQNDQIGLIPSQELEERRKAFVAPEADYVHKIGICGTRVSSTGSERLALVALIYFLLFPLLRSQNANERLCIVL